MAIKKMTHERLVALDGKSVSCVIDGVYTKDCVVGVYGANREVALLDKKCDTYAELGHAFLGWRISSDDMPYEDRVMVAGIVPCGGEG